jgi:hypothetical protein
MADEPRGKKAPQRQIQIQSDPQSAAGVYSNLMLISHRKEEFVLDFLFAHPQQVSEAQSTATLRTRVITSPEHVKRIVRALEENVRRYEAKFGPIEEATDMPKVMH